MKRGIIYALSDPREIDNFKYIGQTTLSLIKRLSGHFTVKSIKGTNGKFDKRTTWIKYLKGLNLRPCIQEIDTCEIEELNFWETHYIFLFRSWGFELKNSNFGGDHIRMTEETKKKISNTKKGKKYIRLNYSHSQTTKDKISKGNLGKTYSTEERLRISKSSMGNTNKRGKILSAESIKNISLSKSDKKIKMYDLQNNFIKTYNYLYEVESDGFCKSKVCACCNGRRKTHGNYKWKYQLI